MCRFGTSQPDPDREDGLLMNASWSTLPQAQTVLRFADDARPAWLWSSDGQRLIWSNEAAGLFLAKIKKHGLKRAAPAVPIKGQVARTIRLGIPGRSSLARIQFRAGEKPVSATCTTTPLVWEHDEAALLIVAVDPIDSDILEEAGVLKDDEDLGPEEMAPAWAQAADASADPEPVDPEPVDPEQFDNVEPVEAKAEPLAADESYARELESWRDVDAETAYETAEQIEAATPTDNDAPQAWEEALANELPPPSPSLKVVEDSAPSVSEDDSRADEGVSQRLSRLVDRLAADEDLYTPLNEGDDAIPMAKPEPEAKTEEAAAPTLYKVTGAGFRALPESEAVSKSPHIEDSDGEPEAIAPEAAEISPSDTPDPDAVERVSRYNFDELSRILSDRVGERNRTVPAAPTPLPTVANTGTGALVNLGGETLVLNRLPLGILVFRDQQVLFANRAITEMVGYDTVESLRSAGLSAIFPALGDEGQQAGPVNHLVQRNGTLVPVTARLQSISWQGRPALMLSASATEVRTSHEDAVKAFAQSFADLRGDGFIEATRAGVVNSASATAIALLASGNKQLTGQPISALVAADETMALREFLERPARFAESARPCLSLRSGDGKADILLFALGQAGIVSGYFGLVHARETTPARLGGPADVDPALLARISRGVRRPLNTIVGFSDLIRSKAFGEIGNERYEGYADDIAKAGHEIAALVDELDDYARLRDGRYLPQRASLDLTALLESCVLRIRDQANAGRVFVRNAISERLPRVTADRASLGQAVLNLLASAIDQTPAGGTVVISAQRLDDGAIAIHVRDSSAHEVDMAERFVVFRDGVDRDGQMLMPVRSSVGLALTRSLLAVNAVSLSVDPAGVEGLLFSLKIPADLVDSRPLPQIPDTN